MKNENQASDTQPAPVARFKIGLNYAAIWANATKSGTTFGITLERRYRDSEGKWHSTNSFRVKDLQAVQELVGRARAELMKLMPSEA